MKKEKVYPYLATKEEYDKAMQEMECWATQSHLKKCKKCREFLAKLVEKF